ncbi:MAG: glycerol kinase GlpK [Betaproteobacteria bacterium]|nr:glycerol kinase GlpK [Betaproteobacteria bacterium]
MTYLLALDQGTSSTRSILFQQDGTVVSMAQTELKQYYPKPGWVEHDPKEIWSSQLITARQALREAGLTGKDVVSIGITNQRETVVVWNKLTGEPIGRALVWQDRRTEPECARLRSQGLSDLVQRRTGLRIDAYFSATKIAWLLRHVPGAKAAAGRGDLAFGTVDSWLIWQLTGGKVHATDVSNASRTMLLNIHTNSWDPDLLAALDVPLAMMPRVQPSCSNFGQTDSKHFGEPIVIGGVAGDQQSALFGQACFNAGQAKNTYGTGCFMLMHTGTQCHTSQNNLITTSAAQPDSKPTYAFEGSVFIGGAVVQWLRDGLQAIQSSAEIQPLCESVPDTGGVIFVPAFTGLGAPYWQPNARGAILGLTRGSTTAHIARAAVESIAYQSVALLLAMSRDAVQSGGLPVKELRVDGGACVNNLLMQFQADLLGIPVVRPKVIETTALGAAYLAGIHAGIYSNLNELASLWQVDRVFEPKMAPAQAQEKMAAWEHAVQQCALGMN